MTEQKPGENPSEINVENLTAEQLAEIEESEKFILDFKDEDLNDPDKSEELKKHLDRTKTTIHQKKHFRDKVANLEKELEPFKKAPKPNPEKKPDQNNDSKEDDRTLAVEFRQDHPELPREVALEVIAHAKAYGITPEEALAKPVIQSYIKSTQKQEDVDEGSPKPKGGGSGSGIEKKDWSNASEAEIEAQRRKIMGV